MNIFHGVANQYSIAGIPSVRARRHPLTTEPGLEVRMADVVQAKNPSSRKPSVIADLFDDVARERAKVAKKMREWRRKNPEKARASSRRSNIKWLADPEKRAALNARHRDRYANDPEYRERCVARNNRRANQEERKNQARDRQSRKRYGLSLADRDAILHSQGGVCAACSADAPGGKHGWHVDHCHTTGRVRAILCHGCNAAAGYVGDDPERLRKLADYLTSHASRIAKLEDMRDKP